MPWVANPGWCQFEDADCESFDGNVTISSGVGVGLNLVAAIVWQTWGCLTANKAL